jgi:5-methylcytosine-specific restriction protein A
MTDHIVAHKGDMRLFWDPKNWQSLCGPCNSRKAALEEGGFGRPIRWAGRGEIFKPKAP